MRFVVMHNMFNTDLQVRRNVTCMACMGIVSEGTGAVHKCVACARARGPLPGELTALSATACDVPHL